VVSVPGNTRFFIVLLEGSGETAAGKTVPAGGRGTTEIASDGTSRPTSQMPSAQELRELIELKAQLNRMYQELGTTQTVGPPAPPQQQ